MQNGQVYAHPSTAAPPPHAATHGALTVDPAASALVPVRRASHPSTSSPTNHQRSQSQSRPQSHPVFYHNGPPIPMMAPPGVEGLSTTHMQHPPHVPPFFQSYQEQLQRQQQQQPQQIVHFFDSHAAQYVITHAPIAPAPPLPSSHPKTRPLVPAQLQTNPQQQQQQQQQQNQNMTHTPTTATMLAPAAVPVRTNPKMEQTPDQVRAQPPAPTPPAGAPPSLAMQVAAATRLREQMRAAPVSAQKQAAAVAGVTSVDASAVPNTPNPGTGTQTRGPHSPVSVRVPAPSSASNAQSSSSQNQHQHQYQRFVTPPALAAFKVLQPAKDLLEQTWAAAINSVQQEFAVLQDDLARFAREKQALNEFLPRMQAERMQALAALRSTQTELRQCAFNLQAERKVRAHLEQRLAEMTQSIEKCTCGAAKKLPTTPTTMTPAPIVLAHVSPALPSTVSSPLPPSSPTSPTTEAHPTASRTPTPASGPVSSPRTTTQSSSPAPESARRHKREEDDADAVQDESAPKRRRIERTPTPPSSAPAPGVMETGTIPTPTAARTPEPQEEPTREAAPRPTAPRPKIGIQHIQLVYETVESTLQCRMCLLRKSEVDPTTPVVSFPLSAEYAELVGHCEQEHEAALEALASMSPDEIVEMRQRLQASQ